MNIRLLVCLGLLVICVKPANSDLLSDVVGIVDTLLGVYLRQKYVTLFYFCDYNENKTLEEADFHLAVDKVAVLRPDESEERVEYLHNVTVPKTWKAFHAMFPRARPASMTLVDLLLQFLYAPAMLLNADTFVDGIFQACDVNGNNIIDREEHRVLYEARGIPNAVNASAASFSESDANGDGFVTRAELRNCAVIYLTAPAKITDRCRDFLGPLVAAKDANGGIL